VKYTYDGTYLVSGSDDTNLRLWKSKASEQLGVVSFLMALTACKLVLCLAMFVTCFCSGALLISGGSLFLFWQVHEASGLFFCYLVMDTYMFALVTIGAL